MQMFIARKINAKGEVTYADVSAKSRREAAAKANVRPKDVWLNSRKH